MRKKSKKKKEEEDEERRKGGHGREGSISNLEGSWHQILYKGDHARYH